MIKSKYFKLIQIIILLFVVIFTTALTGCKAKTKDSSDLISLFVSIEPQRFFIEKIGGQYITTEVMVKPGQNPATYEPTPGQITKLSKSLAFFTIGVPFENSFIGKIKSTLPDLKIVDTTVNIEKREIEDHNHEGNSEEHETKLPDPHVWMSPPLVKKQALIMLNTLVELAPDKADKFRENYNTFIEELDQLNNDLETILKPLKGKTMFVYHPSFGYFADQYGLNQEAIESGGKQPSPRILDTLINEIKQNGVNVIFVQPEFQNSSIQVISEATGAAIIPIEPLNYNYYENLRYIAETLEENLQK